MPSGIPILITIMVVMGGFMLAITTVGHFYNLNSIKSKTVGDGQHGTSRWATQHEMKRIYKIVPFTPEKWRTQARKEETPTVTPRVSPFLFLRNVIRVERGKDPIRIAEKPLPQGVVVGRTRKNKALVDTNDVHVLMVGAAGVGKTAYWLYPCIEYALASGMSFLSTDTKGDIMRNYGYVCKEYGYKVSVLDLRNPTRSNGNNPIHLVNRYMDLAKADPDNVAYRAKAERHAKTIAHAIIMADATTAELGQNTYFYESASGLLTSTILLVSEFCEPEERHIVSVFKIIQELLGPSSVKGKNQFQLLMDELPDDHKAKWFAGSAMNAPEQSMASVLSTALSRLNSFIDSEMEQILCFDTELDAEHFCKEKSALFVVLPEENPTTYFLVSLLLQQFYMEILAVADRNMGRLENRCVFFCDEFGTIPTINSAEQMFTASRSRGLQMVPIIQSYAQLDRNYGKEGSQIIIDTIQTIISGGFAPNSASAETISKALGSRTVLSGSVSKSQESPSQSLQMIERPLMSPDELRNMPKGTFVVMKTGFHPIKVNMELYFNWGIKFDKNRPYILPEHSARKVAYASKQKLIEAIREKYQKKEEKAEEKKTSSGKSQTESMSEKKHMKGAPAENRFSQYRELIEKEGQKHA